jgi:hypothetical protein
MAGSGIPAPATGHTGRDEHSLSLAPAMASNVRARLDEISVI